MSQLEQYVRAAIPEPYIILGVKLRPFSLGHYLLMARFDCAFAADSEKKGGVADLLLGIAICCRTFEDFIEFINEEETFNNWFEQWGKEVKKVMAEPSFNILYKIEDFKSYMRNGIDVPEYCPEERENSKPSGAHWSQSVLLILTSELGYTYSEAVNIPMSKALYDYFKWAETNGMVSLMGDEDKQYAEANSKALTQ